MAKYVEGHCELVEVPPTPYEQLSTRISSVSGRVSAVENDLTQLDTILGGEEVVPNVEAEDVEENESNA